MKVRRSIVASVVFALLAMLLPPAHAATLTEVTGFGSNPGNLRMFYYAPTGLTSGRPVVVAMHGCSQSAAAIDDEWGWTKWADQWNFAVVFPQQQKANNITVCFNWFLHGDHARDSGEALSIKQMVDWMKTNKGSDGARIFATGFSAGGGMTSVMLGAYPDVFKAGAPMAGLAYECADTAGQATSCNNGTVDLTPQQWGDKVRAASTWRGPWPKVSVWHGTSDGTVSPRNLTEIMEQWTNVNGVDQVADTVDTVGGFPHKVYKTTGGSAVVETYEITGMGHSVAVDPGTGATQCGIAGTYQTDVNLCATYQIALWFGVNV